MVWGAWRQGLGIRWLPPGCPCLLRCRLNIPEERGPSFAPVHVWLPGVRLVPRCAARADRKWKGGTFFLSDVALAVSSCLSGCCLRSTGVGLLVLTFPRRLTEVFLTASTFSVSSLYLARQWIHVAPSPGSWKNFAHYLRSGGLAS